MASALLFPWEREGGGKTLAEINLACQSDEGDTGAASVISGAGSGSRGCSCLQQLPMGSEGWAAGLVFSPPELGVGVECVLLWKRVLSACSDLRW